MYYLLGRVLGHSYSKEIHQAFGRYSYALHPLEPEEVAPFLQAGEFAGCNVTIPYKETVMPYLTYIAPEAIAIGSVNTLVKRPDGLYGYNTDFAGFAAAAHRAGLKLAGKKILILGSGGTSKTACAVAKAEGAASVTVLSRQEKRQGNDICFDTYGNILRYADTDILINTTPVGMYPNNGQCPVDLAVFPHLSGVMDVIYNPQRTALLQEAQLRGIPAVGGLYMLVRQAAEACGLFCGQSPKEEEIEEVYRSLLRRKSNIILIGMPGCGKSTVAKRLAAITGRQTVDTDSEIVKRAGMDIPTIFRTEGESGFRRRETEVLRDVCRESGLIIATGGGCVTVAANRPLLRQNGRVYHLTRPLEKLATKGRPLSLSGSIAVLWESRRAHYESFADHQLPLRENAERAANAIWEDFYEHIGTERA